MNDQAILNLLGLAFRAQKVVSGFDLVLQAIAHQRVSFVFVAQETSPKTLKELQYQLSKTKIPSFQKFSQAQLSKAIGRYRKIIAITDPCFARRFQELVTKK